jgi:hypothetical protein
MTAIQSYYAAIASGQVPAVVPIVTRDGSCEGLATVAIPVTENTAKMIMSPYPRIRAAAAVMALEATVENIEARYSNLAASCNERRA